jgi:hypothetical protein
LCRAHKEDALEWFVVVVLRWEENQENSPPWCSEARGVANTSVASTGHVLSRAAVDVRDLCAVTTPHIYGNYCHAIRIRCFSTLYYTGTHLDLAEYFKSYRSATMRERERERLRTLGFRCAARQKFFCSLIIAETYCIALHSDILFVAGRFYLKNSITLNDI